MIQPMFTQPSSEVAVKTKSGVLLGPFDRILGTPILVLLHRRSLWEQGTIFVPNRALTARSPNRTTHLAFPGGLYDAFRSYGHVTRNGGIASALPTGEARSIQEHVGQLVRHARALQAMGLLTTRERNALHEELALLIRSYERVRNEEKVTARALFARANELRDIRGRRNPMAAAMAAGGSITHLKARLAALRSIHDRINARATDVFDAIEAHMGLFREFRRELQPRLEDGNGRSASPAGLLMLLSEPGHGPGAPKRLMNLLRQFIAAFENVHALPFVKKANAVNCWLRHALHELERDADLGAIRGDFERIRHIIAWVFVRHGIETEIIAPLSYLLAERKARGRIARTRSSGLADRTALDRSDEARFTEIGVSIHQYVHSLGDFPESGVSSVHSRLMVFQALESACRSVLSKDWKGVKERLTETAVLL
jgi:hypothetical protein